MCKASAPCMARQERVQHRAETVFHHRRAGCAYNGGILLIHSTTMCTAAAIAIAALCGSTAMAQNTTAPPSSLQIQPAAKPGLATPPPGWSYLAELAPYGPADIFHIVPGKSGDGPATQMQAHTKSNVGI